MENNANPTSPARAWNKTGYVGGFFDSTFGGPAIKSFEFFGNPGDKYFTWTESFELAAWIDVNSGKVTVIGHSYGADTAAEVVASGHPVDRLITVDPVGWTRPDYATVAANSGSWENYYAEGTASWPDFVAGIGGAWNRGPQPYADRFYPVSMDHATICSRYCRP